MSEFLAEARVIVRPDVTGFRTALEAQLLAATRGVTIPISVVAAGAGLGAATAATAALAAAQATAQTSTLGLASAAQVENSAFGRQAVILQSASAATAQLAGVQSAVTTSAKGTTAALLGAGSATAKLDAGLLGLRTALGSTAVIGLGALALAAIVAGKAVSASIRNFASFQQELATFRVVAGASADEMRRVSEQAARLGADVRLPAVSAADAAVAMTELAKAGLTVEDALAGAEGVLQLATAAQISNAEASLIAANALNSFGLAGDQASRVADDLANAANAAQGSIADFGLAFRQSSAVARQVGLSLEDTTAILSLFAKNGLQGSDAGTSLRVALIRLVAPTQAAAAEIKKLGLNIRDAQGNVRADVFAQFGEATATLAPSARDAAAALIFGQDAIRAVAIGAREGAEGLRIMQFEIDQQGTAAEVAAARTEGLAGSFSALESSAQTLSIQVGKLASGPLKNLVDGLAAIAGISTMAIGGLQKVEKAIDDFIEGLPGGEETSEFIDFFATPGKAFSETAKGLNRLISGSDKGAKKIAELNEELQNLQTARTEAERGAAGPSPIAEELTARIQELRAQIKALKDEGKGIDSNLTTPLQKAVGELEKIKSTRGPNVDTSGLDRMISTLQKQILVAQETERENFRLTKTIGFLGSSATNAAVGVDELTRALSQLNTAAAQANDELLKLQNEGAGPQAQIASLRTAEKIQFDIIENLKTGGVTKGEPTAIRAAREEIERIQGQIEGLQREITSVIEKAATDAERAARDRASALERQFDAATLPVERLLERAAGTDPLQDDIKFTNILITIYKRQIAEATKRIKDVVLRNAILKDLDKKLFDAIQDRKRLQRENRQAIRDALVEKLERVQRGTELDIELADINENTKRRISLREKLIQQLLKERKKLHLTGNALKENRNEIARINAEIEAINKEAAKGDKGQSAQQFFFEQLQAQQGFASNLLGNLIPRDQTAGLVGVPSPPPGAGIQVAASVAEGKQRGGPTAGQASTTNDILLRILHQLKELNGDQKNPEAVRQRRVQQAVMDTQNMGGV